MSAHNKETVTGLLDGEVRGLRGWLARRHVSTCPICAMEYRYQQHVRRMLQANPPVATMNDSPEFFWSKVKAEIQRRGEAHVEVPMPARGYFDWLQQHPSVIAAASASVIAVFSILWFAWSFHGTRGSFVRVEQLKTPIPHTAATAFDSEDAGVTVIWVTGLPWTNNMTEMETKFANLDT